VVLLVSEEMPDEKKPVSESKLPFHDKKRGKVKLQVYGEEMLEKVVSSNVNSGRVYLPPDWVGRRVKIIRLD
jgi:putative transposon-encoded protein